jgi:hypothetical protein
LLLWRRRLLHLLGARSRKLPAPRRSPARCESCG